MIISRLVAAAASLFLVSALPLRSVAPPMMPDVVPLAAGEIGLLTYNVQDLPWPLVADRSSDLKAIGARLAALRKTGAAPQLVVLQEAFSQESIAMLRAAGYRHIVEGPSATVSREPADQPLDAAFLAARSTLAGEARDPALSSGLVIASDFPIVGTASTPFPRDACAGVDCLANKGVMLARIQVPGLTRPIELVTTHLNAGAKSRTPTEHHLYAWRQQVRAIERFLQEHSDPQATRLFAGDFNVCHSRDRLATFQTQVRRWGMSPVTAMGKPAFQQLCGRDGPCTGTLPLASNVPLIHTLDWQLLRTAAGTTIEPVARHELFGREPDGTMLSDHIGFSVRYRISG